MVLATSGVLCLGTTGSSDATRQVRTEFSLDADVCLSEAATAAGIGATSCLSDFYGLSAAPAFAPRDYAPTGYDFFTTPANPESAAVWLDGNNNFSVYFPQHETPTPAGDITFANVLGTENATNSNDNSVFTITGTASDGNAIALRRLTNTTDGRRPIDFNVAGDAGQGPQPHAASVYNAWTQIDIDVDYPLFDPGITVPWQIKRGALVANNPFFGVRSYACTYNVNPDAIVNVATGTVTGGDGSYTASNPFTGAITYFERNGWGPAVMGFGLNTAGFGSGTGFDITSWAGCDSTSRVTGIHINSRADNTAFTTGQAHAVRVIGAGTPPTAPFFVVDINGEQYVMRQANLSGLGISVPDFNWTMEQYGSTESGIPAASTALQSGTFDAILAEGS